MARFLAHLFAAVLALAAAPVLAAPIDTGHLEAELVAQTRSIAPGRTVHVALRQEIDKGWHTYWRNSGDSGEPTTIAWTLPPGWKAGDIVWAPPHRQPIGPLMNYGYADEVLLPVAITAPADATPGQTVTLAAKANFLVCEEICVPEEASLTLALQVLADAPQPNPRWGPAIDAALAAAPKPAHLAASFAVQGTALKLAVVGSPLKGLDLADAYFFPFDGSAIDHAKPQAIERGADGLTLTIVPGFGFMSPNPPTELAGVLAVAGRNYEIRAKQGALPAAAAGLGPPAAKASGGTAGGSGLGLAAAALFAFLGGLILNLMPCVFPVLAMKATSLAAHAEDRKAARSQGLAFLAGVLATFLALAGVLIALRAGGAAVGWGFQLQSPPVVASLALLMLGVALNLSGVFEIGQSLQGVGTGLAARRGLVGAFFTGVLAVVVAAPCTAPFMGPAMGWALTQSAPAALGVFLALGLGFAAPFALAAFVPGLLTRLPRPGPWMESFRRLMAFPMYGAAAWLAWVLTVQTGEMGLARILAAAVAVALAAWLFGRWQLGRAEGRKPLALAGVAAAMLALAVFGAVLPPYSASASPDEPAAGALAYEPWSPERLAAAQAEGRPVFVNFTAAWCVSCQVNEKVALSTQKVADAVDATNTLYLKGDWTKKDEIIEAELARHGRAGVPLYLVYGAKGGEGVILPQLLTADTVVRALKDARTR